MEIQTVIGIIVALLIGWVQVAEKRKASAAKRAARQQSRPRHEAPAPGRPLSSAKEWKSSWESGWVASATATMVSPTPDGTASMPLPQEEGQRVTPENPETALPHPSPVPTVAAEEIEDADIARWRRAIIDSEILKTKF